MHHMSHQQKVDGFSHPQKRLYKDFCPFQNYLAKNNQKKMWLLEKLYRFASIPGLIFAIVTLVGWSYTRDYYSYYLGGFINKNKLLLLKKTLSVKGLDEFSSLKLLDVFFTLFELTLFPFAKNEDFHFSRQPINHLIPSQDTHGWHNVPSSFSRRWHEPIRRP